MYTKGTLTLKCTDTVTGKVRTEVLTNVLVRFNLKLASVIRPTGGSWWYERYMHFTSLKIASNNKDVTSLLSDH